MRRPIEEVVASQKKMINHRQTREGNLSAEKLGENLATIVHGMGVSPNFDVLEVEYPMLVQNPEFWAEKVNEFLGGKLDVTKMLACVKPELHRNRATALV